MQPLDEWQFELRRRWRGRGKGECRLWILTPLREEMQMVRINLAAVTEHYLTHIHTLLLERKAASLPEATPLLLLCDIFATAGMAGDEAGPPPY